jgi:hypothetical protein
MNRQCEQCGAPLPAAYGVIRCGYCGREVHGPTPYVPPAPPPYPQMAPRTSAAALAVPLAVMGVLALGGIAAFVSFAARAPDAAPRRVEYRPPLPARQAPTPSIVVERPARQEDVTPRLASRVCAMGDATGDGVREIGALIGRGNDRRARAVMIDGASGELVWEGQPTHQDDIEILCLGDRHVGLLNQGAFELFIYPASGPAQHVQRALSDEVDRFGATETCIELRTEDRNVTSISLDTGQDVSCDAELRRRPHSDYDYTCEIISTIRRPETAEYGEMRYEVQPRRPGTPFLEVSGHRGRTQLWSQTTRFVPVNGESIGCIAMAAGPGVGVTLATLRGGAWNNGLYAVGFDETSGVERYATSLPGGGSAVNLRGMHFNGRHVVVAYSTALIAVEPATGAIAWQLGD